MSVLWVCTVNVPAFTSGNQGGKQTVRIRPSVEYIYRQIHLNWFTDTLWALTDPVFKACGAAGTHTPTNEGTCGHWLYWVYPAVLYQVGLKRKPPRFQRPHMSV